MALIKLLELSGVSLAVGGLMATTGWLAFGLLDPEHTEYSHRRWLPLNFLIIGGGLLMAMGLPGFYYSQAASAGLPGLLGFILFFIGLVIPYVAVHSVETLTMPRIPSRFRILVSVGAPSLFLGTVLTGFTVWQVGLYPPWSAAYLLSTAFLGLLVQVLPAPNWLYRVVSPALFTVAVTIFGILLAGNPQIAG